VRTTVHREGGAAGVFHRHRKRGEGLDKKSERQLMAVSGGGCIPIERNVEIHGARRPGNYGRMRKKGNAIRKKDNSSVQIR